LARAAGFAIDDVVSDNGVSGVSTRLAERDQGKQLFDLLRRGDVLVVRWVDRLARNYADVTDVIREFMKRDIVIRTVINGLIFDGTTKNPMQMADRDALISPSRRRKLRRPRKRSALVSSTLRPATTPTEAGSRPSRPSNWVGSATC
jgi:DNA invertase Pin-like site-specific DNA recombinase